MTFSYTREQYQAMEGLAYRIADNAYMIERYGRDGAAVELEQNRKTIGGLFATLDALAVPFWVQNAVIAFADDWRRWKSQGMAAWLEQNRNIKAAG